jgi:hypothetical protein
LAHGKANYLKRLLGFGFAGVAIFDRTSSASFASLSSRRRAILMRASAVFSSTSSKIAGRCCGARRSLFILAVCREDWSTFLFIRAPILFALYYLHVAIPHEMRADQNKRGRQQVELRQQSGRE